MTTEGDSRIYFPFIFRKDTNKVLTFRLISDIPIEEPVVKLSISTTSLQSPEDAEYALDIEIKLKSLCPNIWEAPFEIKIKRRRQKIMCINFDLWVNKKKHIIF
jgi:hypothetical protein